MATKKNSGISKSKKNSNNLKNNMKKEKHKIDQINSDFDSNIWYYVKVITCVIVFISLFYLLTLYITSKNSNKNDNNNKEDTVETISYSDIMVGRSFTISDGDYFVIYYDKNDEDVNSSCSGAISSYKEKDDHLDIYSVNMGDGLNKKYAKDESNVNPTNASEIAISGPTLIKFSDGEVVEYIEGLDEIVSYLQ